jgi:hypothetical protein
MYSPARLGTRSQKIQRELSRDQKKMDQAESGLKKIWLSLSCDQKKSGPG